LSCAAAHEKKNTKKYLVAPLILRFPRRIVVRSGAGRVVLLDGMCGYRRVCVVQEVAGGGGGVSRSEGGGGEGVRECSAGGEGYWPRWAHEVVCVGESLCASAPAHLRCQCLYFCTSNRSKLSTWSTSVRARPRTSGVSICTFVPGVVSICTFVPVTQVN
jgi:hypothetical protein